MGRGEGEWNDQGASRSGADLTRASAASDVIKHIFENSCGVDGMCAQAAVVLGWRLREMRIPRRLVRGYYETRDGRIEDHCYVVCGEDHILDPTHSQFDRSFSPGAYLPGAESLPEPETLNGVFEYLDETMSEIPDRLSSLRSTLNHCYSA